MMLAVLCAAVAACGGSGSGGNAAVSREFNYGQASTADSSQASAVQSSLTSTLALQGSPDAQNAQGVAEFSGVTTALLGSPVEGLSLTGTSGSVGQRALTRARSAFLSTSDLEDVAFDEACVVSTSTSVTLNNCTVNINETDDGTTITGTITANGSVTLTNANQTLTWDVTVSASVNVSGSDGSGSGSGGGSYHAAGTLTVTAPAGDADGTVVGEMTAELGFHASSGNQSLSIGVHESLALDLTYQSECVTGGTLEAKRVWTDWSVPGESTRPSDKAALVTFTEGGCNTATVQLSN
jgi:hypothetical protein